jgi:hypothetical protein
MIKVLRRPVESALAAPVAVKDHPGDVTTTGDRGHVQPGHDPAGVVLRAHRVAEDPSGVQADDGGQVALALTGDDLGHVPAPGHIRRRRGEHPLDQIRGGRPLTGPGQPAPAAFRPRDQAALGHQSRDGVVADLPALLAELDADARAAGGAAGGVEHLPDRVRQPGPPVLPGCGWPVAPRVAPGLRDSQGSAGHRVRHLMLGPPGQR